MDAEIEEKLKEAQTEGRVTCALARGIAEQLNVSYPDVGRVAERLKLKITDCGLGCF